MMRAAARFASCLAHRMPDELRPAQRVGNDVHTEIVEHDLRQRNAPRWNIKPAASGSLEGVEAAFETT
jgi:hypothetical protein